jgi:hypothetical protein
MHKKSSEFAYGRRSGKWIQSGAADAARESIEASRRHVTPMVGENMPVANAAGAMKVPGMINYHSRRHRD